MHMSSPKMRIILKVALIERKKGFCYFILFIIHDQMGCFGFYLCVFFQINHLNGLQPSRILECNLISTPIIGLTNRLTKQINFVS